MTLFSILDPGIRDSIFISVDCLTTLIVNYFLLSLCTLILEITFFGNYRGKMDRQGQGTRGDNEVIASPIRCRHVALAGSDSTSVQEIPMAPWHSPPKRHIPLPEYSRRGQPLRPTTASHVVILHVSHRDLVRGHHPTWQPRVPPHLSRRILTVKIGFLNSPSARFPSSSP